MRFLAVELAREIDSKLAMMRSYLAEVPAGKLATRVGKRATRRKRRTDPDLIETAVWQTVGEKRWIDRRRLLRKAARMSRASERGVANAVARLLASGQLQEAGERSARCYRRAPEAAGRLDFGEPAAAPRAAVEGG